jgi:hypothetical protein
VTCDDQVEVALTLVNQVALPDKSQIDITFHGPMGNEIITSRHAVPWGVGIKVLGKIAIETGQGPGEYQVSARLVQGQEMLAE